MRSFFPVKYLTTKSSYHTVFLKKDTKELKQTNNKNPSKIKKKKGRKKKKERPRQCLAHGACTAVTAAQILDNF